MEQNTKLKALLVSLVSVTATIAECETRANSELDLGLLQITRNASSFQGLMFGSETGDFSSNLGIEGSTIYIMEDRPVNELERIERETLGAHVKHGEKGAVYFGMVWRF